MNASNVRRFKLQRDGDEGKRLTSTGDIFLGDEEIAGESSLHWPHFTNRGMETCLDAASMTTPLTTNRHANDRKDHHSQSESRALEASGSVAQENSTTGAISSASNGLTDHVTFTGLLSSCRQPIAGKKRANR